ncbi:MAG: WYL domain-containing transcriptional regulator [Gammaproteobacteria bacterium]|nr:MAG: WYL domain-containing transcriptional regulator [Gammaproteobacteria bacterium]
MGSGVGRETLLRLFEELNYISKRQPVTSREIAEHLRSVSEELAVSHRTVQRDLQLLSLAFPLDCELRGKTCYWHFMPGSKLELPAPRQDEAAARLMTGDLAAGWFPPWVGEMLAPMLGGAHEALRETGLGEWARRVRVLSRGPILKPPDLDPEVCRAVLRALAERRVLELNYQSRDAEDWQAYEAHPQALVVVDGVFYLVATLWSYTDLRHLALHRMDNARVTDRPGRRAEGFDLDRYISSEAAFSYPRADAPIRLVALFDPGAAFHLRERRLAEDQRLTAAKDGRIRLEATVADTEALRWWLLGFGDGVEVLAPEALRKELRATLERALRHYRRPRAFA